MIPEGLGWRPVSRDEEVHRYVQEHTLPILSKTTIIQNFWQPYNEPQGEDDWISFLFDQNRIIGYYKGTVYLDALGRRFSTDSYISISPEYQGRGLCKGLAQFSYDKLVTLLQVDYIVITVASVIESGACRCYVRAAKDLGLRTFGSFANSYADYKFIEIVDCNVIGLDHLIFSFTPLDEIMVST
ncbi:putative acyl-CoA N-acyltransferase [Cedratvirus kamchatka]|uniref:Acyl-CoA N-acyltransferase n=1 Tax=Cedratvirus kamchatka TaxID=2716914 RepID=A0A6G8MYT0_9VIRU|nr:putative acyl-CoA N-acyltransferase [Cedratvirus kamchatka]